MPTITKIGETICGQRFRIVGEPDVEESTRKWRQGREGRHDVEPWCEVTIFAQKYASGEPTGEFMVGSYGGELWPSAWPSLFNVGPRTIYGQETKLTPAGRAAFGLETSDADIAAFNGGGPILTAEEVA